MAFVLRVLGKPYIVTLRGGALPQFAARWPNAVRWLLKHASYVQAPSDYLRVSLRKYHADIRLLPNAIDVAKYGLRVRRKARPRLIWIRAFHTIYNPALLPKSIALLVDDFPDIQSIMVGPDKGDGSLTQCVGEAERLGLRDRITFAGGVNNDTLPGWLEKADIFVNTTNYDNCPVSVLEAMAAGLCIVSTSVGGIPYLLVNKENALLVPVDDPEAMSQAIRRILSDPGLAHRLSENAVKSVKGYDWENILTKWEENLETIH
jgi:glycosyltransferase involved in cell wall biosynthesis